MNNMTDLKQLLRDDLFAGHIKSILHETPARSHLRRTSAIYGSWWSLCVTRLLGCGMKEALVEVSQTFQAAVQGDLGALLPECFALDDEPVVAVYAS